MFKIHAYNNERFNENENIFVYYCVNNVHCISNLTLSHIIINVPNLSSDHLNNFGNSPNICLIEYLNGYCPSSVTDFDVINCNKYIRSENKYIHVRKSLHYDGGLRTLYSKYIVNDSRWDSSYYNTIKYYHSEYLDFKPAFDKILNIYEKAIKNNRTDILEYLNIPINTDFAIVCDTNTIMYENYINTGKYDLDKSIILNGINDINYENKNTEWTNKLPREKIEYRYDKVISEDEQIHSLKNNHDLSEINRYGIMDII